MLIKSSELFRMLLALKEAIRIRASIGVLNVLCCTALEDWPNIGSIESVRSANVNTQFERGAVVVSCWKAFTCALTLEDTYVEMSTHDVSA